MSGLNARDTRSAMLAHVRNSEQCKTPLAYLCNTVSARARPNDSFKCTSKGRRHKKGGCNVPDARCGPSRRLVRAESGNENEGDRLAHLDGVQKLRSTATRSASKART